jgi:Mismatch repair ATPase (MutS family)
MTKRKLKTRLTRAYGNEPLTHYHSGDMAQIRKYHDHVAARSEENLIDDITWNDLDMDNVFKKINLGMSSCGEAYLYHTLRKPAHDENDYNRRKSLVEIMESHPKERLETSVALSGLGCPRRADLAAPIDPPKNPMPRLILYTLLALVLAAVAVAVFFFPDLWKCAVGICAFNLILRERRMKKIQLDFENTAFTVSLICTLADVKKVGFGELDAHLEDAYASLDKLRNLAKFEKIISARKGEIMDTLDVIAGLLLIDMIVYELAKNKLSRHHGDIVAIFEAVGSAETAISVASYRKYLENNADYYCLEPELTFGKGDSKFAYIDAKNLVHPCMDESVANDAALTKSMLITGSNASGKSTYIRVTAICAILAQSIGTCTAETYRASAFRIFSSMVISDDLSGGDSYYIAEIKSLRRILRAADDGDTLPVLCVIDEVLRGTNTVERISASCEILLELAANALCIAATHDIELCALTEGVYGMYHFSETVKDGKMSFDYKLKPGITATRNAIKLLSVMDFPPSVVDKANARAADYETKGVW